VVFGDLSNEFCGRAQMRENENEERKENEVRERKGH